MVNKKFFTIIFIALSLSANAQVELKTKKTGSIQQKQEERANAFWGLMILGGLGAIWARIGNVHRSLVQQLSAWVSRRRVEATQKTADFIASEEGRELMPHVTPKSPDNSEER